jgi:hypothetical protein
MKITEMKRLIIVLGVIIIVTSCTENEAFYQNTSSENVAEATIVNYAYKATTKITKETKTSVTLQGIWQTSNSGSKTKWKFSNGQLYKSTIYSFGEVGEPQVFKIDIKDECDGEFDKFGKTITLTSVRNKEKRSICYVVQKESNNTLIL